MRLFFKIAGVVLLIVVVAAIGLFFYAKNRIAHVEDKKDLEGSVGGAARKYIQKGNAYGLVIGIVKGGKTYIKGYGTVNKDATTEPDAFTVMELASTSKLFTTSVLQILCDQGILSLDDKISVLLKEKVILPPTASNTTLRQLATHTSGFPTLPQSFIDIMTDESNPYKNLTTQDLYDYLKGCAEKEQEGKFKYSNLGMGLLGHIIELKTQRKLEDVIKEQLLSQLHMFNTFITVDSAHLKDIAQGYTEEGAPNPIWQDHVLTGAGSFLSNATDMTAFIRANLAANNSPVATSLLKTHGINTQSDKRLGWIAPSDLDSFMGNTDIIWHNGLAGGYASYIAIDKHTQSGIIILSNKAVDITTFGMEMIRMVNTQSRKE